MRELATVLSIVLALNFSVIFNIKIIEEYFYINGTYLYYVCLKYLGNKNKKVEWNKWKMNSRKEGWRNKDRKMEISVLE